jgi:FkbM family methyltransferase
MTRIFSFSYIIKAARVFLSYPKAILKAAKSSESAAVYIYKQRQQKYANNPVIEKRVANYFIHINPEDSDVISPSIGVDAWYEPEETELLKKIVKKGAVVVDVGANVGWYTLLSAHIVGKNGRVIAFEPEPSSFSLLTQSIRRNNFTNIQAFDKCVSNTEGPRKLYLTVGNLGGHSIVRKIGQHSIDVTAVTLDKFLPSLDITHIDLLKIDAEGAESEVIEGAHQYLSNSKVKNIFLEWNADSWTNREKLLQTILSKYTIYQIIRSPFLIKKQSTDFLRHTARADLYLELSN